MRFAFRQMREIVFIRFVVFRAAKHTIKCETHAF